MRNLEQDTLDGSIPLSFFSFLLVRRNGPLHPPPNLANDFGGKRGLGVPICVPMRTFDEDSLESLFPFDKNPPETDFHRDCARYFQN